VGEAVSLRDTAARYALGHTREGMSHPETVLEFLWYLAAFALVGFLASLAFQKGPIQVLIGAALASIVIAAKTAERKIRR
jgi:RsiW-degrading membrane proteinase PrsW (M82 family)